MRTLVLHNEEAGFGSDAVFMFLRYLERPGDEVVLRSLPVGWNAAQEAKHAQGYDLVVVSGGDATVGSLLWGLRGSQTPVCVFPSGTGNLFFANLGNSSEPAALARACRVGATFAADLGSIRWQDPQGAAHERGFTLMSGTGFDATLMRAAVPNKRAMGQAAYLLAALDNPTPPVVRFVVEADGRSVEREAIACLVANTAMIQGDIEIVPDCVANDGLLDVIFLEAPDAVGLLRPLLAGVFDPSGKNLGRPQIERLRCREARVRASRPVPMQIDGTPLAYEVREFSASVVPAAVHLVVDALSPYRPPEPGEPRFSDSGIRPYPEDR